LSVIIIMYINSAYVSK